jgi:hypothetical protein
MQTPVEIEANFTHIHGRVGDFIMERESQEAFDVNQRKHFLIAVTRMLDDWRKTAPCPITCRTFYAHLEELALHVAAFGRIFRDDEKAEATSYDRADYLVPPEDPYGYHTTSDARY